MRSPIKRIPTVDGTFDIYQSDEAGGGCEVYAIERWRHPAGTTLYHYVSHSMLQANPWWRHERRED